MGFSGDALSQSRLQEQAEDLARVGTVGCCGVECTAAAGCGGGWGGGRQSTAAAPFPIAPFVEV